MRFMPLHDSIDRFFDAAKVLAHDLATELQSRRMPPFSFSTIPPFPFPPSELIEIKIKETITEERELVIVPPMPDTAFYGCAAIVRSPGPNKLLMSSIRSGFIEADLICDNQSLDIAFFNVDESEPTLGPVDFKGCPFDFGCFSHVAPLRIVVKPYDGPVELDMVILGASVTLSTLAPNQAPAA